MPVRSLAAAARTGVGEVGEARATARDPVAVGAAPIVGQVGGQHSDALEIMLARVEPDERGRRRPIGTGERREVACDTVIVALGTNPNPIVTRNTKGLALDDRGYVAADPVSQATNLAGVFAGGDIVTGGATVILAMGAGRRAAGCATRAPA